MLLWVVCAAAPGIAAPSDSAATARNHGGAIAGATGSSLSSTGAGLSAQGSSLSGSMSGLGAYETELGTALSLSADVLFEFDKADLNDSAFPKLRQLVDLTKQKRPRQVQVHGHTDGVGTDAYNLNLSRRRAVAVAKWLAANGVSPRLLVTQGFGKSAPIAPNQKPDGSDDPDGRQKNRRVDVLLANVISSIKPIKPKQ